MNEISNNNIKEDSTSKRKSALIAFICLVFISLFVYHYKWKIKEIPPKIEIAVLFEDEDLPEPPPEPIVPKPIERISDKNSSGAKARASNKNTSAKGQRNSSKYKYTPPLNSNVQKRESPVNATPNSAERDLGKEENKKQNNHNEAIRNMREGRNTSGGNGRSNKGSTRSGNRGSRGDGNGTGNDAGFIGNGGRSLIAWVPGTYNSGLAPIESGCENGGTVIFKYTVSASGSVTYVDRASGSSDICLVKIGKSWIRNYVKAEKGTRSASGKYEIKFR